jgi:hypothetical protein
MFLKNKNPHKLCSGYKPNVVYLKIFGSITYIKNIKPEEKKLDDKSQKYVFIGYDEKSKVYKLYDPIEKKLMEEPIGRVDS